MRYVQISKKGNYGNFRYQHKHVNSKKIIFGSFGNLNTANASIYSNEIIQTNNNQIYAGPTFCNPDLDKALLLILHTTNSDLNGIC